MNLIFLFILFFIQSGGFHHVIFMRIYHCTLSVPSLPSLLFPSIGPSKYFLFCFLFSLSQIKVLLMNENVVFCPFLH